MKASINRISDKKKLQPAGAWPIPNLWDPLIYFAVYLTKCLSYMPTKESNLSVSWITMRLNLQQLYFILYLIPGVADGMINCAFEEELCSPGYVCLHFIFFIFFSQTKIVFVHLFKSESKKLSGHNLTTTVKNVKIQIKLI